MVARPTHHMLGYLQRARLGTSTKVCSAEQKLENFTSKKDDMINKLKADQRILFSSYIDSNSELLAYSRKKILYDRFIEKMKPGAKDPIPVSVMKVLMKEEPKEDKVSKIADIPFPVDVYDSYKMEESYPEQNEVPEALTVQEDIQRRMEAYNRKDESVYQDRYSTFTKLEGKKAPRQLESKRINLDIFNHGTPDPSMTRTETLCGGCGAHFHCQDESLPGYIPSEALKSCTKLELMSLVCQRCYFLRVHNIALNVRVTPEQYLESLRPVQHSNAMIVLVIDLFDSPCGVWKGLSQVIGKKRPVIIVGNKIDLLPPDRQGFLEGIKNGFHSTLSQTDIWSSNIRDLKLVSAKTGYGIEDLITSIRTCSQGKGDIYILGCTNAGKSSLFNALLGSDMCMSHNRSLIQRATSSPWPGTTLNLLKFPMMPITGRALKRRESRLAENKSYLRDQQFTKLVEETTKDFSLATLRGTIGRTFAHDKPESKEIGFNIGGIYSDPFSDPKTVQTPTPQLYGNNTNWCYDTPGVVQPEQLISLLTHDELVMTIPKTIIEPQTFTVKSGMSLFLGGLARLDVVYARSFVRLTVFRAETLPLVIMKTVDASGFYREHLGTEVFGAPCGNKERLESWKPLQSRSFSLNGLHEKRSTADVILSSAGFVSVTTRQSNEIDLRAWTPGGRGIYTRQPYLSDAVMLRGPRIRGTVCHGKHSVFIPVEC